MNRLMMFYAYDLDLYRDTLRGFYLDYYNDLPGPIIETEEALLHALTDIPRLKKMYQAQLDTFRATYGPMEDGFAASRVVDAYFNTDQTMCADALELREQPDGSYSI